MSGMSTWCDGRAQAMADMWQGAEFGPRPLSTFSESFQRGYHETWDHLMRELSESEGSR